MGSSVRVGACVCTHGRLYHLRRGPLLGTLLQHRDDIALAQAQFLASALEPSLRQMLPAMCEFVPADADALNVVALQVRAAASPARARGGRTCDHRFSHSPCGCRPCTRSIFRWLSQLPLVNLVLRPNRLVLPHPGLCQGMDGVALTGPPWRSFFLRRESVCGRILLFDDEVTLMVWIGSQVDPATLEWVQPHVTAIANARASARFPRPTLRILRVTARRRGRRPP